MSTYIHSTMTEQNTLDVKCEVRSTILKDTRTFIGKIDTGCSKTMVSLDLLYPNKTENELREIALKLFEWAFKHNRITYACGVESSYSDIIHAKTPNDALDNIHIRVTVDCSNVIINKCVLGPQQMSIAYKAKNRALIGMGVLKGLCTYIGPYKGKIHLVASREAFFNTDKLMSMIGIALQIPDHPDKELIDFSDEQILGANYIQNKLNNTN